MYKYLLYINQRPGYSNYNTRPVHQSLAIHSFPAFDHTICERLARVPDTAGLHCITTDQHRCFSEANMPQLALPPFCKLILAFAEDRYSAPLRSTETITQSWVLVVSQSSSPCNLSLDPSTSLMNLSTPSLKSQFRESTQL